MDYSKVISNLNHLLERSIDAKKGYTEAGNGMPDGNLRLWLFNYCDQRQKFIQELRDEITRLGGEPVESGTFLATLHRAWIDMNSDFSSDPENFIEECIRGEEKALEDYNEVLNEATLPAATREIVQRQSDLIVSAIKDLKNTEMVVEEFID